MKKEMIFEMVRSDLLEEMERMTPENMEEIQEAITKYFQFLFLLKDLKETKDVTPPFLDETTEESLEKSIEEPTENIEEAEEQEDVYLFERKLRGGFIKELQSFVPEKVVRILGLEHGDYVRAIELGRQDEHESKRYRYELAKKGNGEDAPGRVEIDYALVEKDGHLLVVKKTLLNGGEDIRLNEVCHTFLLRDEDIYEFHIQEGDIVDLAYQKQDPRFNRILWKHDSDTKEEEKGLNTPIRNKTKEKEDHFLSPSKEENLKNKKILVVGCEPRKSIYKRNIEERGGIFSWAEGTEGENRLASMITKVDVVVLLIRFIRHRASKDVVRLCKQYGVDFVVVDNLGVQSVIHGVMEKSTA